jgi:hypothetical protein
MPNNLRNQLYARSLKIWEDNTIGTCYLAHRLKAAKEAFVSVSATDRPGLKQQIYRRAIAMGKLLNVANAAASTSPDHSVNYSVETCNNHGDGNSISSVERPRGAGRKGKSGRKQKVPGGELQNTKTNNSTRRKGPRCPPISSQASLYRRGPATSKMSIRESGRRM